MSGSASADRESNRGALRVKGAGLCRMAHKQHLVGILVPLVGRIDAAAANQRQGIQQLAQLEAFESGRSDGGVADSRCSVENVLAGARHVEHRIDGRVDPQHRFTQQFSGTFEVRREATVEWIATPVRQPLEADAPVAKLQVFRQLDSAQHPRRNVGAGISTRPG